MIAMIVLESVDKVFRRGGFFLSAHRRLETYAVKRLSLSILEGEVLSLLGPNGSGKTTTLKLIATVLLPDAGRVLVNGRDSRKETQSVRRKVGFALAAERSFFPRLTVRENLWFFAALENVVGQQARQRIELLLDQVALSASADKQVMKLSSGLYQRLAIARALLKQPRVLLLDEPTRSLDPGAAVRLWSLVRQLSASGITVVLATHNFNEAISVSDRVAVLAKGRLLGVRSISGLVPQELAAYYLTLTGEDLVLSREGISA
jgi:ABC-2 type transport system ATP-binding protein